jgi:hypothetical protein
MKQRIRKRFDDAPGDLQYRAAWDHEIKHAPDGFL